MNALYRQSNSNFKMERTLKDIDNIQAEYTKLQERQKLLNDRFIALGLDYNYYLATEHNDDKLYLIRNNIFYRFYGTLFHIDLLQQSFFDAQNYLHGLFEKAKAEKWDTPFLQSMPVNSLTMTTTMHISSLFDSIVYHLSSIFDYVGNIVNFIFGNKQSHEQALKWSSLASSCRNSKTEFFDLEVGKTIVKTSNDFVEPLYRHRSHLIHKEGDVCHITITLHNTENAPMLLRYMSTQKFCTNFHELRKLSQNHGLTMNFVLFWLCNKVFDTIREILFSLREDIIKKGKLPHERNVGNKKLIFASVSETGFMQSPSTGMWHPQNPL